MSGEVSAYFVLGSPRCPPAPRGKRPPPRWSRRRLPKGSGATSSRQQDGPAAAARDPTVRTEVITPDWRNKVTPGKIGEASENTGKHEKVEGKPWKIAGNRGEHKEIIGKHREP